MEKARRKSKFLASLYYLLNFESEPVKLIIKFNVQTSKFKVLYECCNDFLTGTWQHVYDRNLWHGVATWLETE